MAEHDPAIADRARQTFDSLEDLLTTTVEAAQRSRDIDPTADARALAQLVLAVMRGIEALGKAGKDEAVLLGIADMALTALPASKRRRSRKTAA